MATSFLSGISSIPQSTAHSRACKRVSPTQHRLLESHGCKVCTRKLNCPLQMAPRCQIPVGQAHSARSRRIDYRTACLRIPSLCHVCNSFDGISAYSAATGVPIRCSTSRKVISWLARGSSNSGSAMVSCITFSGLDLHTMTHRYQQSALTHALLAFGSNHVGNWGRASPASPVRDGHHHALIAQQFIQSVSQSVSQSSKQWRG